MSLDGKNVFVTGATGMLGGFLVERLVEEGAEVVALVRDDVPKSYFHNCFEWHRMRRKCCLTFRPRLLNHIPKSRRESNYSR